MLWMWPTGQDGRAPVTGNVGRGPLILAMCPISHPKVYYVAWCYTHMVRR